jgi:hypothetical protein
MWTVKYKEQQKGVLELILLCRNIFRIRNKDTLQKAPRDAEKLKAAFGSKAKTKGRSYAHWRHTKVGYRDWNAKNCIVFVSRKSRWAAASDRGHL